MHGFVVLAALLPPAELAEVRVGRAPTHRVAFAKQ
jgi:hypothetical protein